MRWTDKRPTEPGWYWTRSVKSLVTTPPDIVRVWMRGRQLVASRCGAGAVHDLGWYATRDIDGGVYLNEWSGPIPEPSEPKQEEGGGGG